MSCGRAGSELPMKCEQRVIVVMAQHLIALA
jgi:hypothetical protein